MRERGFEVVSEERFNEIMKKGGPAIGAKYDRIKLPERATEGSAGNDFFMPFTYSLLPGKAVVVPTFIKAYMMEDEFLEFHPRSGAGFKYFLRTANINPIIDSDYYNNPDNEGIIMIKVRNEGTEMLIMREGEAYFQGIFQKYLKADGDNVRSKRVGGGGSTSRSE